MFEGDGSNDRAGLAKWFACRIFPAMFDEPAEDPETRIVDPVQRAKNKSDEFRMHAELCAVFEGVRKFDAKIRTDLNAEIARECQKKIGQLEKARMADSPVISAESAPQAAALLDLPSTQEKISTGDYHIYRRPGETMILRWLVGDEVEIFYTRLQAHFDSAMTQFTEDQKQSHGWKQDPQTQAYLAALETINVKMEEKYLRQAIREHRIFILSTQSADEMDINHLCDFVMGAAAAEIVGEASAPPEEPSERDRAWFFKLFALRGIGGETERMFFFAYLQKSDDGDSW
jgi:hypothetical protein